MSENRHPAGTSLGGQWAPGSSDEVDLSDEDFTPQEQPPREPVKFMDSHDQKAISNLEYRAHRRMAISAARELDEKFPGAAYAAFREDYDNPDAIMFEGVYDADANMMAENGDRNERGHYIDFGSGVSEVETWAQWGHLNEQLDSTQGIDAFDRADDEDSDDYDPDLGSRVVIDIQKEKNEAVPPKENMPAPFDPFNDRVEDVEGRSWSPIVNDDGSGYRMDSVSITRAHDGKKFSQPVENAQQAEAVLFHENRARADGDFVPEKL